MGDITNFTYYNAPTTWYKLALSTGYLQSTPSKCKCPCFRFSDLEKGEDWHDIEKFLKICILYQPAGAANILKIFRISESLSEKEASELMCMWVIQRWWSVSSLFFINFVFFMIDHCGIFCMFASFLFFQLEKLIVTNSRRMLIRTTLVFFSQHIFGFFDAAGYIIVFFTLCNHKS